MAAKATETHSFADHVDDVLVEIARVLQPGGRFIFCVPGDHFTELLFFTQLFRHLGLEALAAGRRRRVAL